MLNWVRFLRSLSLRRFLCGNSYKTFNPTSSAGPAGSAEVLRYLSKAHAVPLVRRLLRLGRVHQLEARLVFLVEVSVLTAAAKLRRIFI